MDIRAMFMGVAFVVIWSSAFTSARIIVQDAPPFMALSLRYLISGVIAIGLAYLLGERIRLDRKQWSLVLIFGICQNGLYLGLFFVAMQWIDASLAAVIASTMPLIVAFISWTVLKERLRPLAITGLAVGFAGVGIIMIERISGGVDLFALMLTGIGVLALAIATLAVRGASSGGNILMIVGLQMLVGSAVLSVPAMAFETYVVTYSPKLFLAFFYTVFFPGLLATWVWFKLVGRIGSTRASTYHFLNPFFGVAFAALILGERIGLQDILGVIVIACGIYAVQVSNRAT